MYLVYRMITTHIPFLIAASDRARRSAKQFGSMVRAKTTLTLSDLNGYGNYCGFRGSGTPVDNIDRYGLNPSHDDLLLSSEANLSR